MYIILLNADTSFFLFMDFNVTMNEGARKTSDITSETEIHGFTHYQTSNSHNNLIDSHRRK